MEQVKFEIFDSKNREVYSEKTNGSWRLRLFDENGQVFYRNSNGHWCRSRYDEKGKLVYLENSDGFVERI